MKQKEENKVIRLKDHQKQQREYKIPVARILLVILSLVVLVLIGIILICPLKKVEVDGLNYYTKKEVMKKVHQKHYVKNTIGYYIQASLFKPEMLPFLNSIDVEITGPNTITLHVHEKKRAGCLQYNGEYVYFDKNGQLLESNSEKFEDVPLITGLKYNSLSIHQKIPAGSKEMFSYILKLTNAIDRYKLKIDQVYIQDDAAWLIKGNLMVDLYNRKYVDMKVSELTGILKKLEGKSGTIDMRYFDEYQKITIFRPKKS
ncbi:cell division protein FtsQ/DivIB [Anaerostipes sp.]|uniref:cell division protein FtsQ/DivIB n=1 Tax=Anaerostipes sp. TaxID=1872530 RepID=UPI003FF018AE